MQPCKLDWCHMKTLKETISDFHHFMSVTYSVFSRGVFFSIKHKVQVYS